jgi:hypothetical protein
MTTKAARIAMLGIGLAAAISMPAGRRVSAQQTNSAEDASVTLAGRKIRIDKNTGKLRDLSPQEARELVATLTAMTSRLEQPIADAPGGWSLDQLQGFDHVLVGRPNDDGSVEVRCVSSLEEAVSFLSQTPKSSDKE